MSAIATLPHHPEALFTILRAATKGSGNVEQTPDVIFHCLAYLSATTFRSVPEFLRYFQDRDVLVLPANQPIELYDLSLLDRLHQEDPDMLPVRGAVVVWFFLNKILALVGKRGCILLDGRGEGEMSTTFSPNLLSVRAAVDWTLQLNRGCIEIRPRHLFQMMAVYGITQITFAPNQCLKFIGVTEEDQRDQSNADTTPITRWRRYAPSGSHVLWVINRMQYTYISGVEEQWYGNARPLRVFEILPPHGMTLLLFPNSPTIIATYNPFVSDA